jgi:hypothetical protein
MLGLIGLLLLAAAPEPAAGFGRGPGEAAGRPRAVRRPPGRADFVVLVWYRRDDPLGTFKYEVYDVRKGEYTAAVADWIREIRTKYPAYLVLERPVDLSRQAGATEALKVGSVIHRELLVAAAGSGVFLGEPLKIGPGPSPGPRINPSPPLGGDRSFLNPPPTAPYYPVYPRLPL